jgi:hypothetical protein
MRAREELEKDFAEVTHAGAHTRDYALQRLAALQLETMLDLRDQLEELTRALHSFARQECLR